MLARCRSVACTNANATVPLTGACTTTAPAASIGYLVNGAVALAATCPAPGVNLQVTAFITGVGGFPECSYNNTGGFVITCEACAVAPRAARALRKQRTQKPHVLAAGAAP